MEGNLIENCGDAGIALTNSEDAVVRDNMILNNGQERGPSGPTGEARTMQNPYHGSITEDVPVPESELVALAKGKRRTINVALVGNPNCGKTTAPPIENAT